MGYHRDDRAPFGCLEVLNDTTLAASKRIMTGGNKASFIVLIPVTGQLMFRKDDEQVSIDAGQMYVSYLEEGSCFELENPYSDHWINFLHVQFTAEVKLFKPRVHQFDIESQTNHLVNVPLSNDLPFSISIGQLMGREDAVYQLTGEHSKLYAFVLSGAFEIEGRLLHERDGLALENLQRAELEALSNHAVVMLIELRS